MLNFIIITLIAFSTPTVNVSGDDFTMTVNVECAEVIENSGYTKAIDIHRKLSATAEYKKACF